MADIIKLTDGTEEISLYLDSSGFEILASGNSFGVADHKHVYHESNAAPGKRLVEERTDNKIWQMKLAVRGDNDDDIANNLARLSRLSANARRYEIKRDVDKVYLHFELDSCTNATYYDVVNIKYSSVALLNYFNRNAQELVFDGLGVEIETRPYGYGDEEELVNQLMTPDFEEDTNSDGLANNWSEIGAPTTTLDTDTYLHGTQSQKVVASSTEGLRSNSLNVEYTYVVGYAWVYLTSGTDITVTLAGNSSDIDSSDYSDATITMEDASGNTWRKIEVSGSRGANATVTMDIESDGTTTSYVDMCYMSGIQTTKAYSGSLKSTPPTAWSSYYKVGPFEFSGTERYYVDVANIPGDIRAGSITSVGLTTGGGSIQGAYIASTSLPAATRVWEIEDWTTDTGGSAWTTVDPDSNASASKSVYTAAAVSTYREPAVEALTAHAGLNGKFKALLRYKLGTANNEFDAYITIYEPRSAGIPAVYFTSDTTTLSVNSTGYHIADMGTVLLTPTANDNPDWAVKFTPRITVERTSGSGNIYLDCIYLIPLEDWVGIIHFAFSTIQAGSDLGYQNMFEEPNAYYINFTGAYDQERIAGVEYVGRSTGLAPRKHNRVQFIVLGDSAGRHISSGDYTTHISYIPRTETILGTK